MSKPPTPPDYKPPPDLPEDPEASYDPGSSAWEAWTVDPVEPLDTEKTWDLSGPGLPPARPSVPFLTQGDAGTAGASDRGKGRFALRKRIAAGGFGEVWEAIQQSLGRTVAVKRLRSRDAPAPPDQKTRTSTVQDSRALEFEFRQEALIAAQLEHPNIIPIYDLGRDEEGRPQIAMKLVRGDLWSDVMRDDFRALPLHDYLSRHLQILISVTQAVAFAHSRQVIHRDLKPTQVMIGRFGEVLLMDWGLAMAYGTPEQIRAAFPSFSADPNSPLFNPVCPAGTPAFMAPEQTRNAPTELGPWTDIYLLGGSLYRILTGRNPHVGSDAATTYMMAMQGVVEPPRFRAQDREVPPQLADLAMKAMAREPSDRFPSAEAFLHALQDYMTGADNRRESLELTRRVQDRLGSSETDYAVLAEGLNDLDQSLVLWPLNADAHHLRQDVLFRYARAARDNRDLKLARVQAERLDPSPERDQLLNEIHDLEEEQRRQDERLEAAYRQASIDRDRAEEARGRADHMRDRAENLVGFLIGDLHSALKAIGRLDVIEHVTQTSLDYFKTLPEHETTDQTMRNRVLANLNIGDVLTDQGRKPDALDSYQKARELIETLIAHNPDQEDCLSTLADCCDRIGQVFYYQGRMDDAFLEHNRALQIRRRLVESAPRNPANLAGEASTLHKLGIVFWRQQNLDRALELHQQALEILRRLVAADPDELEVQSTLAWTLSTLGNVYRDIGNIDQAIEVSTEALDIRESLRNREPRNVSRSDDFLWIQSNLALLYLFRGDLEKSLELFGRYMPLRRRLLEEDPANVVRITAVTFPLSLMGEILFGLERLEESETTLKECLELTSNLFTRDPTSTHVISAYARLHAQLGEVLVAQNRWEEAEDLLQIAVDMGRKALEHAPRNVMTIKATTTSLILRGRIARRFKRKKQATKLWQEARGILDRIQISGDETDVLDLTTQLTLLLGTGDDVAPWIEKLREKRWITPSMKGVWQETGYKPNS